MATPILAYRKYTERLVPQSLFFKVFALSMKGSIKKIAKSIEDISNGYWWFECLSKGT